MKGARFADLHARPAGYHRPAAREPKPANVHPSGTWRGRRGVASDGSRSSRGTGLETRVVSAHHVGQLLRGLEKLGHPTDGLDGVAATIGVGERRPGLRIAMLALVDLIGQAEALTGDRLIALRAGCVTPMRALLSTVLQTQLTLQRAIEVLQRLLPLSGDRLRLDLEVGEERTCIVFDNGSREHPQLAPVTEFAIALLACDLRELVYEPLPILWFHFPHPPRGPEDEYQRLLGAPVAFEQHRCAIAIPTPALGWRTRRADPEAARALETEARRRLAQIGNSRFLTQVAAALRRQIEDDVGVEAQAVASSLGVSLRTMQRRLREERTSFRAALASVRRDIATDLLLDPSRSVSSVARRLGFATVSSFDRAYRRWTGNAPRREHGGTSSAISKGVPACRRPP